MTHYKKHWIFLLSKRLLDGERVIIKKEIYAEFLCYLLNCDLIPDDFLIKTTETTGSVIIKKDIYVQSKRII